MSAFFLPLPWSHPFLGLFILIVGCCVGSFLNVCIYRIPLGLSIVSPSSRCSSCGLHLKALENLPLWGWLRRGGRCGCGLTRVDFRYAVVEGATGLLWWILWLRFSPELFAVHAFFLSGLLVACLIDWDHFILPDRFTWGGIWAGPVISLLVPALHESTSPQTSLAASLLGAVTGGGLLYGIAWIGKKVFRKEAMGMGDVKLMAALGAFLGWQATLFILGVASVLGSGAGLFLLVQGIPRWGIRLPFGPFLGLAGLIWVFEGWQILTWYRNMLQVPGAP